jgi:non-heme chloroperoxidase
MRRALLLPILFLVAGAETPGRAVLGDIELHYAEQGTGPTVVLVHGSLADYSYWALSGQLSQLSKEFRVVAYSRRFNYPNRNEYDGHHSAIVEAQDLAGFLDLLGAAPVHLVGHSYGAYTALIYALDHPQRVRSLVLAEAPILPWLPGIPGGEGITEDFMSAVWTPLGRTFAEQGDAAGLEHTSQWYFGGPLANAPPEWQVLFSRNVREWRALTLSPEAFPPVEEMRVRALQVPILLLSGGENAGGFNDLIDAHLEHLAPNAQRLVIPEASHEMFLDFPDQCAHALLEFFRSVPPGS